MSCKVKHGIYSVFDFKLAVTSRLNFLMACLFNCTRKPNLAGRIGLREKEMHWHAGTTTAKTY